MTVRPVKNPHVGTILKDPFEKLSSHSEGGFENCTNVHRVRNALITSVFQTANEDLERINKDVNIDEVHNLMDSLVEAREDIDEIGGALATEIIPDSNLFDQGLFFSLWFHQFY